MNALPQLTASDDQLALGSRPVTPGPVPQNDAARLLALLNQFWDGLETAMDQHDPDTLYELGNLIADGDGPSIGVNDKPWIEATQAMVKRKADHAYEEWADDRGRAGL